MPRVEVTLGSYYDISFKVSKAFDYDKEDWDEMSPDDREAMIKEDCEQFLHEAVEWEWKILS